MAFTASEQELYDFAKATIPGWVFQKPRAEEIFEAFVKMFDRVRTNLGEGRARSLILQSIGIWLDLHAADRGTQRQDGESNEALQARIRNVEEAVTRPAILSAAQAIVDAEGISGTVRGLELKRDKAFFGTFTARTGTGGTFVDTGVDDIMEFTPSTLYPLPIEIFARSGAQGNPRITFATSTSAGNDGTFEVIGLNGNAVRYVNAAGVGEIDAVTAWSVTKHDVEGNSREGRRRAYFGRGYRMSGNLPLSFIIIIPFGCTAGTQASILEMARVKKAYGVVSLVECRANP